MAAELEFSVLHFGPFGGLEQAISEITYIDLPLLEFNESNDCHQYLCLERERVDCL